MWFCKKQVPTEEAGKSRKELEAELAQCKKIIEQVNEDLTKCTPMIDFDTMRVFSIERLAQNNRPCTIIGYYTQDPVISSDGEMIVMKDTVHEWTLYCSNDRHEELVKKYLDWKKK